MPSVRALLEEGLTRHKAGQLAAAEALYRKVLTQAPRQGDALFLLGRLKYQTDALDEAVALLRRAIAVDPDHALAHLTLALVLERQGRIEEAIEHLEAARKLDPRSAQAAYNLANALVRAERFAEAELSFGAALALDPSFAAAHNNLGLLYERLGRDQNALDSLARAIDADPDCLAAYSNRANLLGKTGRLPEAISLMRGVVERAPDYADSRAVLSRLLREEGDFASAESEARRAFELGPDNFLAANELGKSLQVNGRLAEAEAAYRRAAQLDPNSAETWNNLGTAVLQQQRVEESLSLYRRAIAVDAGYSGAWSNLGNALLDVDEVTEARECLLTVARRKERPFPWLLRADTLCPTIYEDADQILTLRRVVMDALVRFRDSAPRAPLRDLIEAACHPSFNFPFHGLDDRPLKEAFAAVFAPSFESEPPPLGNEQPHVGVVITHDDWAFRRSVGGIFDRLDPARVKVTIVCQPAALASLRAFFTNPLVRFMTFAVDLERAAREIRAARFDIVYHWEVATSALSYFLPFLRLAPIQVTSWGIQVTSGIAAMDHYVSSKLVETEESDHFYSERLFRLGTMMSYQSRLPCPAAPVGRAAFGLEPGDHVYLCLQQPGKLHPDFDSILRALLERDPLGRIVLLEGKHPSIRARVERRFHRTLGELAKRVLFLPMQRGENYASLYLAGDVVIEPTHFGGVNTTYDSLSLGKAVVTLPSRFFRCRYTFGCYTQMGYTECVAGSASDYIDKAVRLATEPDYRRGVEAAIAESSSALFEHAPSVRELEDFFVWAHADAARAAGRTEWVPAPVAANPVASPEPARTPLGNERAWTLPFFEPVDPARAAITRDVIQLLAASLRSLGREVRFAARLPDRQGLNLIVGTEGVFSPTDLEGCRYAVYQIQSLADPTSLTPTAVAVLRGALEVWAYRAEHLPILATLGVRSVRHVPLGFHEELRRVRRATQDLDVLFLASRTARQAAVVHTLANGLTVKAAGAARGADRDQLIARAKVVLLVAGRDGEAIDEAALPYLLANRTCVVVEESGPELPWQGLIRVPYANLALTCRSLVASSEERYRAARQAHDGFHQHLMTDALRAILEG